MLAISNFICYPFYIYYITKRENVKPPFNENEKNLQMVDGLYNSGRLWIKLVFNFDSIE